MADIVVVRSPLKGEREFLNLQPGQKFDEWLTAYVARIPGKLGTPKLYRSGEPVPLPWDFEIEERGHFLLVFEPAAPLMAAFALMSFWQIVASTLVGAAISAVISLIFRPKKPSAQNQWEPSPVYSLGAPTNTARIGEPIPVIYGTVVQVPPLASQPYAYFDHNDQFVCEILCIGQGWHDVHEILVGESTITGFPPGVVDWWIFQPDQHNAVFGTIENSTGIMENVVTSREVADQELLASNQLTSSIPSTWYWRASGQVSGDDFPSMPDWPNISTIPMSPPPTLGTTGQYITSIRATTHSFSWTGATFTATAMHPPPYPATSVIPPPTTTTAGEKPIGWFDMSKPGQYGSRAFLDFVFPGGLYTQKSDGGFEVAQVDVWIEFRQVDDTGVPFGTVEAWTQSFLSSSNTPQRYTKTFDLPAVGRWRCRCTRISLSDGKTSTSDRVLWTGLKMQVTATPNTQVCYGVVTLLAIRIKATNGITSEAAARIRCRVTRRLRRLVDPVEPLLGTSNPADAFCDILTAHYGAHRDRVAEIDLEGLWNAYVKWAGRNGFNAVFDQRTTIWEALQLSVQAVFASPLPIGQKMTVVHDDRQPLRLAMFSEQNIVPSTMTVGYEFDKVGTPTGVRVEYRDPTSFDAAFVILPEDSVDNQTVTVFGCTNRSVALQHAQLTLNRRALQRKSISFETELEGLLLRVGDRFAVAHQLAHWGQSARLLHANGSTLTLDSALDWSLGSAWSVLLRDPQGSPSQIDGVVRGTADNEIVLPGAVPAWLVGQPDELEPTHVFLGDSVREVSDWTCTNVEPRDEAKIAVEGVNYNTAVYPW